MERTEKRKRGKDQTWDHEKKEMKKTTNERKKRQVMTTTTDNDDGNDDGNSYKLEKMMNSNDPGGRKNSMETTYDDNEKGEIGVFDFPWLKKGEDVNFGAEIDELCLDSTFVTACCCSTSYDYDDLVETLSIFPTTCSCNNNNIATTITTTITSNSCGHDLYDTNIKAFDLDLDLDLDLIDQFFAENLSTTGTADQSSHDSQLKMNKIEDEQLKFQVDDTKDGT